VSDTTTTTEEIGRRTILRTEWVPCKAAFIDCKTPGSELKENYAFIGPGVSQNTGQFINLTTPHGFNVGAAGMPNGVRNNLHLHFTAEVFINFGGEFQLRWGADGEQGEYSSSDGDVISVPTWIFRGFTNTGPDDGLLLTVLGGDDTGGIIWGPKVLADAAGHGLHLTANNQLIDTTAGEQVPEGVELIRPMPQEQIDALDSFSVEEFASRVTRAAERRWVAQPFLCSVLPGGGAELSPVIGYGAVEDRRAVPALTEPHGFSLAWLRAPRGEGVLTHRQRATQVVLVRSGRWVVRVGRGDQQQVVELGPLDMFSVPPGSWRSVSCVEDGADGRGEAAVVNGGDGRVDLEWDDDVVRAARTAGRVLDANRYLAPAAVLDTATLDD